MYFYFIIDIIFLFLFQDLVDSLEELEHNLEPETAASVVPPGSQNKVIGSPDALSVCSDVRGEDPNHYTAGADSGVEDDDNLSVTHGDDGSEQKTGFQNNLGRKFSADVSLEKMLMSAAAKAKKFAKEKQLGRVSLPARSKSVDHAGSHSLEKFMSLDLSESEGLGLNARRLSDLNAEVGAVGFDVQGTGTWQELPGTEQAGGLLLVKKISNTSASHSDDSESRLSGAETPPVPEEERWVLCKVALVASNGSHWLWDDNESCVDQSCLGIPRRILPGMAAKSQPAPIRLLTGRARE